METVTTGNKKVREQFKKYMVETMTLPEIKRYAKSFPYEYDFNIYQQGNLDVYDYDLFLRLQGLGIDTHAVKEFEKVLNTGCTGDHRENLRNTYKQLVRRCTQELLAL